GRRASAVRRPSLTAAAAARGGAVAAGGAFAHAVELLLSVGLERLVLERHDRIGEARAPVLRHDGAARRRHDERDEDEAAHQKRAPRLTPPPLGTTAGATSRRWRARQ